MNNSNPKLSQLKGSAMSTPATASASQYSFLDGFFPLSVGALSAMTCLEYRHFQNGTIT